MSPSFQFFDFVYIKTNNNPFFNKVLYLKNNYQDLHTTTLKLTKSSGVERGTSFYSPLWSQFKKFRISKFYFFFISLYGLTTVNMCIRFKIAYDICGKLFTRLTNFQGFALSVVWKTYSTPL